MGVNYACSPKMLFVRYARYNYYFLDIGLQLTTGGNHALPYVDCDFFCLGMGWGGGGGGEGMMCFSAHA